MPTSHDGRAIALVLVIPLKPYSQSRNPPIPLLQPPVCKRYGATRGLSQHNVSCCDRTYRETVRSSPSILTNGSPPTQHPVNGQRTPST